MIDVTKVLLSYRMLNPSFLGYPVFGVGVVLSDKGFIDFISGYPGNHCVSGLTVFPLAGYLAKSVAVFAASVFVW
jgi:hypothetical protein